MRVPSLVGVLGASAVGAVLSQYINLFSLFGASEPARPSSPAAVSSSSAPIPWVSVNDGTGTLSCIRDLSEGYYVSGNNDQMNGFQVKNGEIIFASKVNGDDWVWKSPAGDRENTRVVLVKGSASVDPLKIDNLETTASRVLARARDKCDQIVEATRLMALPVNHKYGDSKGSIESTAMRPGMYDAVAALIQSEFK